MRAWVVMVVMGVAFALASGTRLATNTAPSKQTELERRRALWDQIGDRPEREIPQKWIELINSVPVGESLKLPANTEAAPVLAARRIVAQQLDAIGVARFLGTPLHGWEKRFDFTLTRRATGVYRSDLKKCTVQIRGAGYATGWMLWCDFGAGRGQFIEAWTMITSEISEPRSYSTSSTRISGRLR